MKRDPPQSQPLTDAQRDTAGRNVGLVYAMVNLMKIDDAHRDDAIVAGEDALMKATRSFKPERGYKFSTYACRAIRCGLYSEYGKRLRRLKRMRNESDFGDGTFTPFDSRGQLDPEPEYDSESFESMRHCLDRLDPRTRDIIQRRYGIGCPAEKLVDIGKRWDMTSGRVQQIEADGVRLMAKLMVGLPGGVLE